MRVLSITQINYFLIDKKAYLVDLPGYGFAKRAPADKAKWSALTDGYFTQNPNIDRLSLDSLVENVELIDTIKDARLSLFLTFENYIPFAVTAELDFLDEMGEIVAFEGMNDIALAYPKVENHVAVEPGKSNVEIAVSYSDLDKLASIKVSSTYNGSTIILSFILTTGKS